MYPKGNKEDCLSVYLDAPDATALPLGWFRFAKFSLTLVNQLQSSNSITKGCHNWFTQETVFFAVHKGILTSKADVYSFGVILLVIVSWKRSVFQSNGGTEVLVITANEKEQQGNLEDMVDKNLDTYNTQQALTILQLAVKCTSNTPKY